MSTVKVPTVYRGLDRSLTLTGRACVSAKAQALYRAIDHQFGVWRHRGMVATYQFGDAEAATPTRFDGATSAAHQWKIQNGLGHRWIMVRVLTAGGTSLSAIPGLTCETTTLTFEAALARPAYTASNGWDAPVVPGLLREFVGLFEVTPSTASTANEDEIIVDQLNASTSLARLGAISVEYLPVSEIDWLDDTWRPPSTDVASGVDIIDTDYDDPALYVQYLRRFQKKLLWTNNKRVTTTDTDPDICLYTQSKTLPLRFDLNLYPVLPESSTASVTCRVLARDSGANQGNVTFDFDGANLSIDNITTGAPAWYEVTGDVNKDTETVCLKGWNDSAGTLVVFAAEVYQNRESV